jgi:DNA-binding response OmpR family regulator
MMRTNHRRTVLVVDGDRRELRRTVEVVEKAGYKVISSDNSIGAIGALHSAPADVVVLGVSEINLHEWLGLRRLRDLYKVPIVLLTSRLDYRYMRKDADHGVFALLSRPANPEELVRQLSLVANAREVNEEASSVFQHEGLRIEWRNLEVSVNRKTVDLSPTEFRLLSLLVSRRGWVLSYDDILASVWGANYVGDKSNVKLYVWYLRRKLEADPKRPCWILTKYGIGYYFIGPDPATDDTVTHLNGNGAHDAGHSNGHRNAHPRPEPASL